MHRRGGRQRRRPGGAAARGKVQGRDALALGGSSVQHILLVEDVDRVAGFEVLNYS